MTLVPLTKIQAESIACRYGEDAIDALTRPNTRYSKKRAVACIYALSLIGGPKALQAIITWAGDEQLLGPLIRACPSFIDYFESYYEDVMLPTSKAFISKFDTKTS